MKRTSSIFPSFYSIPKKVKGFNTENKSISCIENMPNEIFYEIFDYLNTSKYNPKADFIVPTTLNEPFSKLKYLIIHHSCTVNTLISMLNHTPELSHLTCQQLNASKNEIANEISIRHPDLRFIFIRRCEVKFDDFETFITMFATNLKTLYINADVNQAYLDANRWQRLITNSMPRLSRFHLKYFGTRKNNSKNNQLDMKINQFISTFWFEEGCYLKIKTDSLFIQCSILPARKTWFSFQDNLQTDQNMNTTEQENNDPSRIFSSHIQLFIPFKNDINLSEVLQMQMKSIFSTSLFLNLHVDCMNISSDVLMGILCLSPYFNSLKISSFESIKLEHLSSENVEKGLRHLTSDSNKITKIYLEQLDSFANIDYLSTFCPHIQHLEVDCINDNHLLPTIQLILEKLTKNNLGIKYLCLHIPGINKKMTHPVQAMIEYKNLLINYTIEYKPNKIILQWK
ncbi:hypothetical protein I4U23_003989 [Adineta vaga]|nr:hypothetical protein I4U23_003989 [Adineta vaga]